MRRLAAQAAAAAGTASRAGRADILLPAGEIRDAPGDSDRARRCRAAARCWACRSSASSGASRRPRAAASASARQVGDQLRTDFADNPRDDVTVVIPDATGSAPAEMGRYAANSRRCPRSRRCRRRVALLSAASGRTALGADRGERRQRVLDRHAPPRRCTRRPPRRSSTRLHAVPRPGRTARAVDRAPRRSTGTPPTP